MWNKQLLKVYFSSVLNYPKADFLHNFNDDEVMGELDISTEPPSRVEIEKAFKS